MANHRHAVTARVWVYASAVVLVIVAVVLLVLAEGPTTSGELPRSLLLVLKQAGQLLLALGLTTAIGLEREARHKPAGVRTVAMVGLGACVFGLIGDGISGQADALSRVVQGVVTGIGFLGAGTIIKEQFHIEGLTTAAALWAAAAIGLACGLALYQLAILGTLAVFLVLVGLKVIERTLRPQ